MIETKTYSKMLYSIADECRASTGDPVRVSPDALDEAAERLDAQTVTIRSLEISSDELATAMRDVFPVAHRMALELECLLMDTKDLPTVSKWWDSAHEALEQWRKFCREDSKVGSGETATARSEQAHYPEEWGPSDNRRLMCVCGNPDPFHGSKTPNH